jgi:hypothetical protein
MPTKGARSAVITAARVTDGLRPCAGPGCTRPAAPRGRYCGTTCRVRAHQERRGCARCRGKAVVELMAAQAAGVTPR